MRKRLLQFLAPLLTITILFIAFTVLHRLLRNHHYSEVAAYLRGLPAWKVALALASTACSYLALTLYDALGVRAIGHQLPYRRIALVSFIGYAFNNNFGFAGLAGNSLRYRIYTSWGLSTVEVAKVIGFCVISFWIGFLTVAGLAFLIDPMEVPGGLSLTIQSLRPLGAVFLAPVLAYLGWCIFRKKPIRLFKWNLRLPRPRILLAQIALSGLDWTLAALVFYSLLPTEGQVSFPQILGVFLLAQIAGLISHVPGGLGVFEAVVLLSLSAPHSILPHPFPQSQVFAATVAYRGIYYLLPLGFAVVLLGIHELRVQLWRARERGAARVWSAPVIVGQILRWKGFAAPAMTMRLVGEWVPSLVPNVFAIAVFVTGAILLFSGATPSLAERVGLVRSFFPGVFIDTAHLLASLAGAALLLVARGLYRRLDSAYILTLILLAAAIPASLVKGLDYEEASILFVLLMALIPCRSHFYRKANLMTRFSISPAWALAVGLTIASSVWLGFFSFKSRHHHPGLAHATVVHDHSRFLRATLGAIGLVTLYGLNLVLRPVPPQFVVLAEDDWATVRRIIGNSANTYAWLAMLRDKKILFNTRRNAFLMYGIEGRSWVAMGDPVGPREERAELCWEFRELSDAHGGWTTFYQVTPENLPLYLDLGLVPLKIGEEATVPLHSFCIEGQKHKSLRHTHHRLAREGFQFQVLPPDRIPEILPGLKKVSDAWLQAKKAPEKQFSLGCFNESYLLECPLAVVRDPMGEIAAFANIWASGAKQELSVDMMRYLPGASRGMMDYLFVELLLWGKAEGWARFNLGAAPLAGLEAKALAPLWTRIGSVIFRHGEDFHHLRGLRQYKEKFDPVWAPTYLVSPGGIALPMIVLNLTSLVSHGLRGLYAGGSSPGTPPVGATEVRTSS